MLDTKVSYVNKKSVMVHVAAMLVVLVPTLLFTYNSYIGFIVFLIASLIVLDDMKRIDGLTVFYILILTQTALAKIVIPGSNSTITACIYVYFLFVFVYEICYIRIPTKYILFAFAWIATRCATGMMNGDSIIAVLWSSVPIIIAFTMLCVVIRKPYYGSLLMVLLCYTSFIVCIVGYMELAMGRTFFYSMWTGEERYRYGILRMGSTLEDPNYICLFQIVMLMVFKLSAIKKYFNKYTLKVFSTLIFLQIMLTGSRTGLIVLAIVHICYFAITYKKLSIVSIPLFVLLTFPVYEFVQDIISVDVSSNDSRFRVLYSAINFWKEKWLWGHGLQGYISMSLKLIGNELDTMNTYVNQLTGFGIVGLSFYLTLFFMNIKFAVKKVRLLNKNDTYCIIIAFTAWMTMAMTLDTFTTVFFWIFPCIIYWLYCYNNEIRKKDKCE